ncbi:formate/nitrite transporter family protein [Peptoniphilus asaccharolyticus]
MYKELTSSLANAAKGKVGMYKNSKLVYAVTSGVAGMYIGFGVLSMGLSGSVFGGSDFPFSKIFSGIIFTMALSLVMMAGGDLFTGNILVLSSGAYNEEISTKEAITVCAFSYFGNFLGALVLSGLFLGTGLGNESIGEAIVQLAIAKAHHTTMEIFFRGILCNVLVCLGVLTGYKLKTEAAKLIMIFWCILPFVALGFEHSVANMTVFTLGISLSDEVNMAMALHNIIPATIGNILGGLLISSAYFALNRGEVINNTQKG